MESPKVVSLGTSLLVPSVQELAKEPMTTVPPRYARPDEDPLIISDGTSLPVVPVSDIQSLFYGESMDLELEKLHSACKEWGFFQVVNHGVSASLVEKIKLEVQEFFQLPLEEKEKLWQKPDEQEGFGQLFVVSEEQKLDWSDLFYITTLPTSLRKSHLFENLPPSFRETLEGYSSEIRKLEMTILGQMTKSLNIEAEEMRELFNDGMQSMRLNYYPPCPQPDITIGLTPHSDSGALTILLQINETEGLQIRKDGNWVPVKPLPNGFVVNVGDIMEIISNGIYRSIEHRAIVNSTKERLSIATFSIPKLGAELGPAPSIISPHKPPLFRRVPVEKYLKEFFAKKLSGKSHLDFMRIENGEGTTT